MRSILLKMTVNPKSTFIHNQAIGSKDKISPLASNDILNNLNILRDYYRHPFRPHHHYTLKQSRLLLCH